MFYFFLFFMAGFDEQTVVTFDLKNFQYVIAKHGIVVRAGKASGGRCWCSDIKRICKTPIGVFFVLKKQGENYRSPLYPLGCKGKKCAKMAWAVKFLYSGESIHASNDDWIHMKHRSHGCIHVPYKDAKWINKFVGQNTKIIVLPY